LTKIAKEGKSGSPLKSAMAQRAAATNSGGTNTPGMNNSIAGGSSKNLSKK
jgi:hypothetical protein